MTSRLELILKAIVQTGHKWTLGNIFLFPQTIKVNYMTMTVNYIFQHDNISLYY